MPGIGAGLAALGQGMEDLSVPLAEQAGRDAAAKAITLDDQGRVQVATPQTNPFVFGRAGVAQAKAVEASAVANLANRIGPDMTDLRQKFVGDPQGFQDAYGQYAQSLRSKFPGPLGEDAFQRAMSAGAQHYSSIVNEKANRDAEIGKQAINAQIDDAQNKVIQIVRGGGQDAPVAEYLQNQIAGWRQQLVANPRFGYSKEKIDSDAERFGDEVRYAAVTGQIDRWKAEGRTVDEMSRAAKAAILDAKDGTSDATRKQAFAWAQARILEQTDEQKAKIAGAQAASQGLISLYTAGKPPTDAQYDEVMEQARRVGDFDSQMKLRAQRDAFLSYRTGGVVPGAPLAVNGGGAAFDPANTDRYLNVTRSIENPTGNPRAVSPTGASGDFQFTRGTAAQYGVTDRFDPAQSREGARRLAIDNAAYLTKTLGRAPTEGEVYLAHQQGAAGAAALLQHPELPAVQALATYAYKGDIAKADQSIRVNGGSPTMTAGQFAAKWTSRFGGTASPMSPIPFTPEQIRENPYLVSAAVAQFQHDSKQQVALAGRGADAIMTKIGAGIIPQAQEVAGFLQVANAHPDDLALQARATTVRAAFAAAPVAEQIAGLPPGAAQAVLDRADALARNSPSMYTIEYARQLRDQTGARQKALTDNPHAYAARPDVGWTPGLPPPIDPSNPDSVVNGIQARRRSAEAIAVRTGQSPDDLLFSGPDIQSLTNAMATLPGDRLQPIMSALAHGLTIEEQSALAGNRGFASAVTGMFTSGDPAKVGLAAGYMRQQFERNPVMFESKYGKDTIAKMAAYEDAIQSKSPEERAKFINSWNDPGAERARTFLDGEADKHLEKVTAHDVSSQFRSLIRVPGTAADDPVSIGLTGSAAEMRGDYAEWFKLSYRYNGGDKAQAAARADEMVAKKWGVSALNGNRVMAYAPETAKNAKGEPLYPADAFGRRDYFNDQLTAVIRERLGGEPGTAPPADAPVDDLGRPVAPGTPNRMLTPANADRLAQERAPWEAAARSRVLIPDGTTKTNIAAGKPPSYQVGYTDDKGRMQVLEDRPGVPLRFFADPNAGLEPARAEMDRRRAWNSAVRAADVPPYDPGFSSITTMGAQQPAVQEGRSAGGSLPSGQIDAGNVDLAKYPAFQLDANGKPDTEPHVLQQDGKFIVVPSLAFDDAKGTMRALTEDQAVKQYDRTGQHLGTFDSIEAAADFIQSLERSNAPQWKRK